MATGPYALLGAKLVELGYAAIPIMPGTKRPGVKRGGTWSGLMDWRERWTLRPPSSFEIAAWSATEAGVCVVCGPASGGLVAIDVDSEVPEVIDAILAVIPASMVRKRGKKGLTLFFYGPTIEKSRSFHPFVDVIGPGRQTVLPPTMHPDTGAPYEWLTVDTLEHVRPHELPEITPAHIEAIGEVLAQFGFNAPDRKVLAGTGGEDIKPHRALNNHALANLDLWVPLLGLVRCRKSREGYEAVADWRASGSGQPIEKRKLNLKISRNGIRDFGVDKAYTPLDLWCTACAVDLDVAYRALSDATGWFGEVITIGAANGRSLVPVRDDSDVVTIEKPEMIPNGNFPLSEPESVGGVERFDESLTYPGGLVEEIIDWITDTARQPNRVLALGAALSVVGTLIGRRAAGPTSSATHLYVVTLAKSGAGKDHALKCISRLLEAAGAKQHIGTSEFISMSAVLAFVQRMPLSLCPQDEFGSFLKRVLNTRKTSSQEQGITKVLRSMWSTSFDPVPMPEWAGKPSVTVYTPAMSICGVSTPEEFFESLQGADIKNGFLNRFLVIETTESTRKSDPRLPREVPPALKAKLAALYRWNPDAKEIALARLNDYTLDARPEVVEWADDGAKKAFTDFEEITERRMARDSFAEPFLARAAEISIRLATIVAAGHDGRAAVVTAEHVAWGRRIAEASTNIMLGGAHKHMAENDAQARHKAILRIVEEAGSITKNELTRVLAGRIPAREKESILSELIEAGRIFNVQERSGGRPRVLFVSEKVKNFRQENSHDVSLTYDERSPSGAAQGAYVK